jgi:hypothetical protein
MNLFRLTGITFARKFVPTKNNIYLDITCFFSSSLTGKIKFFVCNKKNYYEYGDPFHKMMQRHKIFYIFSQKRQEK